MNDLLLSLLPDQADPYVPLMVGALAAVAILIVGWIVSKWVSRLLRRMMLGRKVDSALVGFIAAIAQYTVLAATVITALGKVGVESTSLVAILGAAGLAVGFALQGSLGNFASGVLMLLFRPIDIGERVQVAGIAGVVKDIGLFATTLHTPDNETIIVPNAKITDDSIINYARQGQCRANISIGVAYGTDLGQAMGVIQKACCEADLVMEDPAPSVAFDGFGASSLDLLARPWCKPENFPAMQHNVRIKIYEALNTAGIEIPFDQVVIHKA